MASMSSLQIFSRSAYSPAISSRIGAIILQGPHHSAIRLPICPPSQTPLHSPGSLAPWAHWSCRIRHPGTYVHNKLDRRLLRSYATACTRCKWIYRFNERPGAQSSLLERVDHVALTTLVQTDGRSWVGGAVARRSQGSATRSKFRSIETVALRGRWVCPCSGWRHA